MSHRLAIPLLSCIAISALSACSAQTMAPQTTAAGNASSAATAGSTAPQPSDDAKPFAIGTLQAIALRDGALSFPNDNKVFGVGHSPDEVAALLRAANAATDQLQLGLQPLLVKTADRVLLFDTGGGTNFGSGAGHLQAALAAAGVAPQSVTDIFISHAHRDHVGGLVDAKGALAFPNATIHLSAPEWAFFSGMNADTAKRINNYPALIAAIKPKIATFAPNAEIVAGVVKAVEIKGHTPGHSGYLIGAGADTLLYVGDALHHYVVSVQKPEWPNGFDADQAAAVASRATLLQQVATKGQRIYALHFPFPGLGKIEKRGDGYVWVAE